MPNCTNPDLIQLVTWHLSLWAYNITTPFYLLMSVPGNILLLIAFYKQLKTEKIYMYQVYYATAKTLESVFRSLCYLAMQFTAAGLGAVWHSFQGELSKCYVCVWYSSHLAAPLSNSSSALSLYLAVAMAFDRVLSLWKPLVYKNLNHGRNQKIILGMCIFWAFSASLFDCFRSYTQPDGPDKYKQMIDLNYLALPVVTFFALFRVFLQSTALLALIILSVSMCWLYHTKFVKNFNKIMANEQKQAEAKQNEKSLTNITLVECGLTVMSISITVAYYTIAYSSQNVYDCLKLALFSVTDMSRMIVDTLNFYIIFALNKKFRQMIKGVLCSNTGITTVQVISPSGRDAGAAQR